VAPSVHIGAKKCMFVWFLLRELLRVYLSLMKDPKSHFNLEATPNKDGSRP